MSAKMRNFRKLSLFVAIFCVLSTAAVMMRGQSASTPSTSTASTSKPPASKPTTGVPDDWTHHHMVFSNPGTLDDAEKNGTADQWFKITTDPRYQLQQLKRNRMQRTSTGAQTSTATTAVASTSTTAITAAASKKKKGSTTLKQDWGMNVGSANASSTGTVGTLSGTTVSSSSTVIVDGVTFDASAPASATGTGAFSAAPTAYSNPPITIVNGTNTLSLTTNATGAYNTGTFTQAPTSSSTIQVTNTTTSAVTNLATNATASSATATVNAVPNSTATVATIVSGATTLNLSTNATATTATGTFSGIPTSATSIAIGSGGNTLTMTPNATAASTSVTVNVVPTSATAHALTITNGDGTVNMTPTGATGSSVTGTFNAVPTSATDPAITINQGTATTTLTNSATAASTTFTVGSVPTSASTNALTIVNADGTIHMTPSGATASTVTGTFSAVPTSSTDPSITINQGTATTTLTNSATAASTTFTVGSVPTSAGTTALTIVNADGTINMTPSGASASTVTGTFNAVPTSATDPSITIKQGSATTTLTNSATAASTTFTVGSVPTSASTTALTIVNADGTINMTPSGATSSTATGTFHAIPTSATAPSITITQGAGPTTTTLTTGATTSSATAAFSTAGTTSTTAKIVNAITGATGVTFTGSSGGGTIAVTAAFSAPTPSLTIGTSPGTTYTFSTSTSCVTSATNCIYVEASFSGGTSANWAQNIEAAINDMPSECGVTSGGKCFGTTITAAAAGVTASIVTAGTVSVSVNSGTPNFYLSATTADLALTPDNIGSGTISAAVNACSSLNAGTFAIGANADASATNLYTAIMSTSCQTNTPIGVTASSPGAGSSFTITGTQLGYATFTAGGTGLTLTAAGGNATANGTTACTGTTGTFALAAASTVPTTALEIAQLQTALGDCTGTGLTGGTISGSSLPVSQTALGYDPNFAVSSTQTGTFSWGSVSLGSNGTANSCSTHTAGTFLLAPASTLPTTSTVASALATALNACANSGVGTVTASTNTDPITDSVLGYATFSAANGLSVTPANGGTNGTTACTGTTGTFALAAASTVPTTALAIAQLKTALGDCTGTGVTGGTVAGSSLPVTDNSLGYDTSLTASSTQTGTFSWGSVSYGSNGTANSCSTPTAGTFVLAPASTLPTTSTVASALATALNACANSGVGTVTASTNTDPITDSVLGYATFTAANGLSVTPANGGTNGTTACTGTTGTFALAAASTVPTTALAIAQLKTALGDCTGTGVTGGTVAGSSLPVTDNSLGYDTSLTASSTQTGTFSWGSVSYGSNGTANSCSTPTAGTFVLAPASTLPTTSTVASALATALNACANSGVGTVTASTNTDPITDSVLGYATFSAANGLSVTPANGGTNGTTACTGTTGTFALAAASTVPTTALAIAQLKTALGDCTGTGVTGGTVTGSSLPVTDSSLGYDTTLTAASTQTGTFSWGAVTYGSNGTANACGTPTAGTFLLAPASTLPTTSTVASGLTTALGMCPTTAGVSYNTLSANTFNVADTVLGYATFTSPSGNLTLGAGSAGTNGSDVCSTISGGNFAIGTASAVPTTALSASNLRTAINDCPTGTGVSASYTTGSSAFTATDASILGNDTNFTVSGNQSGVFAWTGPTLGSNGTSSCTTPASATFALAGSGIPPTTSTIATQMAGAINSCSASVGVSAGSISGNTFVETDTTLGAGTFTGSTDLLWSGITTGSNGTGPSCTSSSPFTANYVVAQTVAGLAQNAVAAINSCPTSAGIVATYTSGGAFRVANSTFGSATSTLSTTDSNVTGIFSWGTLTAGSNGSVGCTGNTTGTYVFSSTLSTLATDLNSAINTCTASTTGVTSTTTGAPANGVLLTASAAGSGGNSISLGNASGIFTWSGADLTGGSNGTTSGTATPPTFAYWSVNNYSQTATAANLATAITQNTTTNAAVSAAAGGDTVVVTALVSGSAGDYPVSEANFSAFTWNPATDLGGAGGSNAVGAGQYPAKYSFSDSSEGLCADQTTPDYVVYNTGVAGGSTQANIIAYDNIYSGCPTTTVPVPNVYWSYHTGPGSVLTSSILSLDGTKVAFIESPAGGAAILRVLQWTPAEGTDSDSPVSPDNTYTNSYAGAGGNTAWSAVSTNCPTTASCMISVPFQDGNNDKVSSPWYDYGTDTLWVGDSAGLLHEFTGVFLGTPAEMTNTAGSCGTPCVWPITVAAGEALTSPVFDANSLLTFVGAAGGHIYSVTNTNNADTVHASSQLGFATADMADAPLVDPTAGTHGEVYAFVGRNQTGVGATAAVYQCGETALTTCAEQGIGTAEATTGTIPVYDGTFDNSYYNSANPNLPTGVIWVCGRPGGAPELLGVPITNNVMSTGSLYGPISSSTTTACSPVTEVYTGTDDYVFVAPQTQAASPYDACVQSEGCVVLFQVDVGGTAIQASEIVSQAWPGNGISGMVIDTLNTTGEAGTGTNNVYFGVLGTSSTPCGGNGIAGGGTGGCAIQGLTGAASP